MVLRNQFLTLHNPSRPLRSFAGICDPLRDFATLRGHSWSFTVLRVHSVVFSRSFAVILRPCAVFRGPSRSLITSVAVLRDPSRPFSALCRPLLRFPVNYDPSLSFAVLLFPSLSLAVIPVLPSALLHTFAIILRPSKVIHSPSRSLLGLSGSFNAFCDRLRSLFCPSRCL